MMEIDSRPSDLPYQLASYDIARMPATLILFGPLIGDGADNFRWHSPCHSGKHRLSHSEKEVTNNMKLRPAVDIFKIIFVVLAAFYLTACVTTKGSTPAEKRAAVDQMSSDVLNELFDVKQSARAEVNNAPGYGVFSNANVNVLLASFGGGHGVVHDNNSGVDTYMKMGEVGVGLGVGVKDYRIVFVFHDVQTMEEFVNSGWEFGGQADAAAKAGDKGAAIGGEALLDRVTVYQITESGLALQATVKGTKYWIDEDLN